MCPRKSKKSNAGSSVHRSKRWMSLLIIIYENGIIIQTRIVDLCFFFSMLRRPARFIIGCTYVRRYDLWRKDME